MRQFCWKRMPCLGCAHSPFCSRRAVVLDSSMSFPLCCVSWPYQAAMTSEAPRRNHHLCHKNVITLRYARLIRLGSRTAGKLRSKLRLLIQKLCLLKFSCRRPCGRCCWRSMACTCTCHKAAITNVYQRHSLRSPAPGRTVLVNSARSLFWGDSLHRRHLELGGMAVLF